MKNFLTFIFGFFCFFATAQQSQSFYRIDKVVEQNGRGHHETEYQINGGVIFRNDSVTVNVPWLQFQTFPANNCSFEREENGTTARYQIGIYCNPDRMVAVEKWVAVSRGNDIIFVRQWGREYYLETPLPAE